MKRLLGVFLMACIVLLAATVTPYQPFEENFVTLEPVVTTKEATILDYMQAQLQANEGVANIAGYLYMDELLADVVMTSQADNETYLHQSRSGAYAFAGELFFSQASKVQDANSSLDMTRIYGHNMKIGTKFGSLAFLFDQANNRPLYYYDGVRFKTFTLARIFQFVDGTANFEQALDTGIAKNEYLDYISDNALVSYVDTFDVGAKDVLFLQTCVNDQGNERYVFIFVEEVE